MSKAQLTPVSLLAATVAVGIMLLYAAANHGFGYETTIAGLTLLLVLFAYNDDGYRQAFQSIAFAAAAGFCFMLAAGFPIAAGMRPKSPDEWSAGAWVGSTLLFFAVDRLRAGSLESASMAISPSSFAPVSYPSAPPPAPAPAPVAPISFNPPPQRATFEPPPPPPIAFETAPPATPEPLPYLPPEPAPQPVPLPQAAPLSVAPIPPGREALIFLNLLGEGLNVLRSVKAEHLGRDYYRIADIMPENERWEYQPNQVVRCRKKLSPMASTW